MYSKKMKKPAITFFLSLTLICFSVVTAGAAGIPDELVPIGQVVGISINTDGVMVSELSEIETAEGKKAPAKDAGILPGDIITMINGQKIDCSATLMSVLENVPEGKIAVQFTRNGETMQTSITPCRVDGGVFIGVWIRDAMTGIGTVTFYDPESKVFGALGHSICDTETGELFPIGSGKILSAQVSGIVPGKCGTPGQLGGTFSLEDVEGEIVENSSVGIFGFMSDGADCIEGKALPIGKKADIKTGDAVILSAASGEIKEYDIEITRVYSDSIDGRTMMIKVTDDDLIALTGGIVQGMSGSPIIQNGKIIGAVTHVLINDPLKGYGVSVEEMLGACRELNLYEDTAA